MVATSTSLWPTPTVSSSSTSLPDASSTSSACSVASEMPPSWPRVDIERMNTPASRKWSLSRMRSPSTAPCAERAGWVDRDHADGLLSRRSSVTSDASRLDLPTPGGPVKPGHDRPTGVRVQLADELIGGRVAVLDQADGARDRPLLAGQHAGHQRRCGRSRGGRSCRLQAAVERVQQRVVLVRQADRDAYAGGRAERRQRPHDHALALQPGRQRGAVTDLGADEVGGGRLEPQPARLQLGLQPPRSPRFARAGGPARRRRPGWRQRGRAGSETSNGAAHLAQLGDHDRRWRDARSRCAARPGRRSSRTCAARPRSAAAAWAADRIDVTGVVDVLVVGGVDHDQHALGHGVQERRQRRRRRRCRRWGCWGCRRRRCGWRR